MRVSELRALVEAERNPRKTKRRKTHKLTPRQRAIRDAGSYSALGVEVRGGLPYGVIGRGL